MGWFQTRECLIKTLIQKMNFFQPLIYSICLSFKIKSYLWINFSFSHLNEKKKVLKSIKFIEKRAKNS
jgi:hypothetical protein